MLSIPLLTKVFLLTFCQVGIPFDPGQTILVAHLPGDSIFAGTIVVENLLDRERAIVLSAYDANGTKMAEPKLVLAANERRLMTPAEVFGSDTVSYFQVTPGRLEEQAEGEVDSLTGIRAGVEFQFRENADSRTYVAGTPSPTKHWRVFTGNWNEIFDGVALLASKICGETVVELSHFDREGHLLATLGMNLPGSVFAKGLLDLSAVFQPSPGSYVDITSNNPLAVTALRGSRSGGAGAPYLVTNAAMPIDRFMGERARLEENRKKFESLGVGLAYILVQNHGCNCLDPITQKVALRVIDNYIQTFHFEDSGEEVEPSYFQYFLTVSQLFGLIERAIDTDPDSLKVSYDDTYGYPTEVVIDWEACAADEETLIYNTDFRPLRD